MVLGTGKKGLALIKKFEGCRLEAYKCPGGVWTIGYGHTSGVKQGQRITKTQAEEYLKSDLKVYEGYVNKYVKVKLNQNQFDALVSFTYNCGGGSLKKSLLLTKLNKGDYEGAANEFLRWNKASGKVLVGLVKRRKEERSLFLTTESFNVKITAYSLNVRKGAGIKYDSIGFVHKNQVKTIVEVNGIWGKLSSGGWISLKYATKI